MEVAMRNLLTVATLGFFLALSGCGQSVQAPQGEAPMGPPFQEADERPRGGGNSVSQGEMDQEQRDQIQQQSPETDS